MNGHAEEDVSASCEHVFDQFVSAVTCKSILSTFHQLLDLTGLRHVDHAHFYEQLKLKLKGSWKAQNLWAKLDKRASHRDYKKGQACSNIKVLIIGSGPCGLRTAIECALLGAKTVIVEKRDRFSRNNVLHLWPFLITDLRNLGAKKFFGKFCAGAIDHISIRQLQCILLKVALLLGVEVHVNVAFEELIEPPEDQSLGVGWRCRVSPPDHVLSEYEFDVLLGADGKRNTLSGFKRKEFRGKLAIAVTANFINRNTQAEARVQEISGVAFIFNQKFFLDLKESTRIDLENIVYYKDDTHYFVMTAKKASLLEKGVLKEDYSDTLALLDRSNVNQDALMAFAKEAADFSTNYQLPHLEYAVNHYGQADVAMFDFTSMFAAENASRFVLKNGHHLLMGLVGDSLLEPFWPTGSGCARGFLGGFDAAWMMRSWALGKSPLQVLAERESIYTVLSQTTPNYLHKNHNSYSLDPNTRYPNLNTRNVKPSQVRHLYEGGVFDEKELEEEDLAAVVPAKRARNFEQSIDSYSLLRWCQRVLNTGKYRHVHVVDFTSSWRSGLALCALIHSFRPELVNNTLLMESDVVANNQLAFNIAEQELGIPPVMSGEDMASYEVPDKLTMVSYLSQFYDLFKHEPLPSTIPLPVKSKRKSMAKDAKQPKSPRSPNRRISFLQKLSSKLARSKKRKEQEENEGAPLGSKKLKEKQEKGEVELTHYSKLPMEEIANRLQLDRRTDIKVSKTEEMSGAVSVTAMADLLVAKFKSNESQPPPEPVRRMKGQPSLLAASAASEFCTFCHKRVYIMERMSAEGVFFHRGCLKCDHCNVGLRLTNYTCDRDSKPLKFYCYRHALPEMRTRSHRKRMLEEDVKENLPEVVVTPAADLDTGQASQQKSPRKNAPAHLSPLALPSDVLEKPKKTPERVEFEISFDGQEEESEEEQFEHNLRASLSSDTLLDDEDSDSDSELSDSELEEFAYLSESEIAHILESWSGDEDEVWENAVESLTSPRAPLTLEEACELKNSWSRQHSQENLVEAVEENRHSTARREYTRLGAEEGDEEEGSSTEVEEGSEYETDDTSEESDEDKTEPARTGSNDASLRSPISPVSRLSASKASFFSEPPTVVSLDPWSMFGMGNKGAEKEPVKSEASEESSKVKRKRSSASDRKKSSSSESKSVSVRKKSTDSKKDASSKDTDISESLELDERSDVFADRNENLSAADSLDELKEDLPEMIVSDEEKKRTESISSSELIMEGSEKVKPPSILKKKSVESLIVVDSDNMSIRELEKGAEGDDEDMADDEDELLEKTAVSLAMEQLLHDFDHKSPSKDSSGEHLQNSSDSAENEAYVEGRLSPSASKTRKFRMKRHIRRSKERRMSRSDSEAGRTDPTTDTSQPCSSMSRSPSLDVEEPPNDVMEPNSSHGIEESETQCVVEDKNKLEEKKPDLEESGSLTLGTDTGDDTLQQVLENIAAMPELSENSDLDDIVLQNVDDRFVTDRRRKKTGVKLKKKTKAKLVEAEGGARQEKQEAQVNSSFSISTPSDSESSVSSLEGDDFAGAVLELEPGDDDIKPDQAMLKDYTTTMSLALGESYSDDAEEVAEEANNAGQDSKTVPRADNIIDRNRAVPEADLDDEEEEEVVNEKGQGQKTGNVDSETTGDSSMFVTPDVSVETQDSTVKTPSPESVALRRPLPVPKSQAPVPQPRKSLHSPTKASSNNSLSLNTPDKGENRESSGSEIFLSPVESFSESPLVNKSQGAQIPSSTTPSSSKEITSTNAAKQQNASSSHSPLPPKNTAVSTATAFKSQRKLPELPKLNIPNKQPLRSSSGGKNVESPIMCSSPKFRDKSSVPDARQSGRALPVPKTSQEDSKNKVTAKPVSSNMSKPVPNASQKGVFVKPITPPVSQSTSKTKVPLDKSRLKLGSSSDRQESDHEAEQKKKISAEGIVISRGGEDDIPFADDSETDDKFYTPLAPEKKERPTFHSSQQPVPDARKRILPSSPTVPKSEPAVLSAEQIREIRKADMEKAKFQARERARLKSDEELGVAEVISGNLVRTPRKDEKNGERNHVRSVSYDTQSTSDVLSDSDDNKLSHTATSSATEGDHLALPKSNTGKKKKAKTPKKKKDKKVVKDKDSDTRERRKSLLGLLLPTKSADKGTRDSAALASDSTPKGSDDDSKDKTKTPKSKKTKVSRNKVGSVEDLDKTPSSETKKDLAICSVFHTEASNRQARRQLGIDGTRKALPVAPKASVDELSDSDESHISLSTMQRRREEDLDERVARRLRKIQLKQQKQAEQKRLRMAQEIQRQLEEVEVKQRELEERGIAVEKALRGDGPEGEDVDENQLMSEWFTLVHEKNALLRYESELNVRAKELELEDRQARLELNFRERSKLPARAGRPDLRHLKNTAKTESDIAAEGHLLDELLDVVEQRNNLVAMLEEDRLREQKEDSDLKDMMAEKGFVLSPMSFDTRRERQKIEAPLATLAL